MKTKNIIFTLNILYSILFIPSLNLVSIFRMGLIGLVVWATIWAILIFGSMIFSIVALVRHRGLLALMSLVPLIAAIIAIILFDNYFCINSSSCPESYNSMMTVQSILQIIPAAITITCFVILTKRQKSQ